MLGYFTLGQDMLCYDRLLQFMTDKVGLDQDISG